MDTQTKTTAAEPAKVPEPTKEDRVNSLVAGYAHGLENNAPRTPAELAELRLLLDHKGLSTITLAPEQYAARDAMVNINTPRMSVYDALNSHFEVGSVIPSSVKTADVTPAMVALYPDWKGHSFFVVGDEIFLVDPARKLEGIVAAPDRSKIVPPTPEQAAAREAAVKADQERLAADQRRLEADRASR